MPIIFGVISLINLIVVTLWTPLCGHWWIRGRGELARKLQGSGIIGDIPPLSSDYILYELPHSRP